MRWALVFSVAKLVNLTLYVAHGPWRPTPHRTGPPLRPPRRGVRAEVGRERRAGPRWPRPARPPAPGLSRPHLPRVGYALRGVQGAGRRPGRRRRSDPAAHSDGAGAARFRAHQVVSRFQHMPERPETRAPPKAPPRAGPLLRPLWRMMVAEPPTKAPRRPKRARRTPRTGSPPEPPATAAAPSPRVPPRRDGRNNRATAEPLPSLARPSRHPCHPGRAGFFRTCGDRAFLRPKRFVFVIYTDQPSAFAASITATAWPSTFTLRHTRAILPSASTRNVARSIPMYFLP